MLSELASAVLELNSFKSLITRITKPVVTVITRSGIPNSTGNVINAYPGTTQLKWSFTLTWIANGLFLSL